MRDAHLAPLFKHLWERPRVCFPNPSSPDSFGWWRGKAGGDDRSFAQVAAAVRAGGVPRTAMGDRGGGRSGGWRDNTARGGFGGGRKVPPPNQSRHMVWQRPDPPPETSGGARSGGGEVGDRWEAGARAMSGATKEKTAGTREPPLPLPPPGQTATKSNAKICINCSLPGHFAPRCPTIRCEKCNKLGHMAQLCQVLRPWECIPFMCGFQSPGQGFFYIPDKCAAKHGVEKTNNVVITIVEGDATVKIIEQEFNDIFAKKPGKKKWRCTTHSIGPAQYVMRFPNASEVERACCYGKRLPLKEGSIVVCITPWTASIGAKGIMEKAWVRVCNIPIEKRCTEHIAYAGALVGITLEVDESSVHKPEYARILLGCRDVEKIPPSAEGMLGEQYYDFFYEVEKVVTMGAEKSQSYTAVDSSASPSFPKKARMDSYPASSMGQGETSVSMSGNFSSQNYDKGMQRLPVVAKSEEEEESDEGNNTELLIETMAREHAAEKVSYYGAQSEKNSCENVSLNLGVEEMIESPSNEISVYKDYVVWPHLPHIVLLEEGSMEGGDNCSVYTVECPSGSPIRACVAHEEEVPRRQKQKLEIVGEVAANRMKKRNLEGLLKEEEKAKLQAGVKRLASAAAALADKPFLRGRPLLGDGDGIQIG